MKGHDNKLALGTNGRVPGAAVWVGTAHGGWRGSPPAPQFGLSGEIRSRTNPAGESRDLSP